VGVEVKRVLDNGLDATLRDLQTHRRDIEALPDTGVPGDCAVNWPKT
jgi:hypothetical protein